MEAVVQIGLIFGRRWLRVLLLTFVLVSLIGLTACAAVRVWIESGAALVDAETRAAEQASSALPTPLPSPTLRLRTRKGRENEGCANNKGRI